MRRRSTFWSRASVSSRSSGPSKPLEIDDQLALARRDDVRAGSGETVRDWRGG